MDSRAPGAVPPLPPPAPPAGAGDVAALLRSLPAVGAVLECLDEADRGQAPHAEWTEEIRRALGELRAKVLAGDLGPVALAGQARPTALREAARRRIERRRDPGCVRVVNGTGVVLHTNLGRAAMPPAALEALAAHAPGYALLAADQAGGERSPRERHVEALLRRLTGCEAATVVNNNAAATLLALAALAAGREVIVARGQLVEIGGAYRIPDVMKQSGATLVEVGTTNRVHLKDYENAVTPRTALLMRVHTSNYRVEGFHAEVALGDLVRLGRAYGVAVVDDLGSGALVSLSAQGVAGDEPLVRDSLAAGADLVTASGDKLIGGPQMGLLLGTQEMVARVRVHPLYRALRCDKLTLIAMEATLRLFLDPDTLARTHPTYAMLTARREGLLDRARALAVRASALQGAREAGLEARAVEADDAVGAGALPTARLPGAAVALRCAGVEAGELARRLRAAPTPVFGTVGDGAVRIHVRTLLAGDEEEVLSALDAALRGGAGPGGGGSS
jgi:L-seryl-tRNA(Ser) seleniumtransferase